jgi:hypothetical protein
MIQNEPIDIYTDHLDETITTFEALQDRDSFRRLLEGTTFEQTTTMDFETGTYLHLFRDDLPVGIGETILFTDRFWVHSVHAQLTELSDKQQPDQPEAVPDWTLQLSMAITRDQTKDPAGTVFTFLSTPLETVCSTTNLNGDHINWRASALTGQNMLLTMLGSAIADEGKAGLDGKNIYEEFKATQAQAPLSTVTMGAALSQLGQRFGTNQRSSLSYLPHPTVDDRALVVRVDESEHPDTDNRQFEFYMSREFIPWAAEADADISHTATLSLRSETVSHNGVALKALASLYGKRFPTDIPLRDLQFAVRMGMYDHSDSHVFNPDIEPVRYGNVVVALMSVIEPNLLPYLLYDSVTLPDTDSTDI